MASSRPAALLLLVLAACVAACAARDLLALSQDNPRAAYGAWRELHGKQKASEDRFSVFEANAAFIRKHNAEHASHKLDLNEYADLTWDEFSRTKLGFDGAKQARRNRPLTGFRHKDVTPPPAVDWREKNVVTTVKNQGACGSCWAFSAVGAIEGVNALHTGKLVSLSEQELVDCDTETGNAGCGGGLMDWAFDWIKNNGGIDTEGDWGYYSSWGFGTWCNARKQKDRHVVTIDGHEDVPKDDEHALKQAASQQPVAVGICASPAMQFYSGGVIDTCCNDLNHGVLVVGYGSDPATNSDYWLVKNSWGGSWGDAGYFKLKIGAGGKEGLCGIATSASYPVKEHDNPQVPRMCDPFGWSECAFGSSCSCALPFFFNWFCIRHDCCPLRHGVGCADNAHCCPHDAPVCDTAQGVCTSEDGTKSLPWTLKEPAKYQEDRAAAAAAVVAAREEQPQQQKSTTTERVAVV